MLLSCLWLHNPKPESLTQRENYIPLILHYFSHMYFYFFNTISKNKSLRFCLFCICFVLAFYVAPVLKLLPFFSTVRKTKILPPPRPRHWKERFPSSINECYKKTQTHKLCSLNTIHIAQYFQIMRAKSISKIKWVCIAKKKKKKKKSLLFNSRKFYKGEIKTS